jgi:site-specific DNA-methyltransferase (adenine-specific)
MELNRIYNEDCIGPNGMCLIPDKSIDMILCDLPYGTTRCKWDTVIPFEPLWEQYERIIKDNGAIVLTASQPFTSALVMSRPKLFRYSMVWSKVRVTGHLNAKRMPLREHEDICVFYKKLGTYNPQMKQGTPHVRGPWGRHSRGTDVYGEFVDDSSRQYESDLYYPTSIVTFRSELKSIHPTQKPVPLFEYLIKTYTNEGDVVLDNCMGSGTTAVACINTKRNFIGFELNKEYWEIANRRVAEAQSLFV